MNTRRVGSFLLGHEIRVAAPSSCFASACISLAAAPNNSSLFPPLAAVTVVANHSIARPIAYGNRVPPQRTVFGETTDPQTDDSVSDINFDKGGILTDVSFDAAGR